MKKGYPSTTLHATLTFTSQHVDSTQGHGSKWKAVPHFVYCRCALVVHPSPAPVLHTVQCGNSMKCSIRKTFSPLPSAVGELNVTPERLRAARDSSHRRTDGRTDGRTEEFKLNVATQQLVKGRYMKEKVLLSEWSVDRGHVTDWRRTILHYWRLGLFEKLATLQPPLSSEVHGQVGRWWMKVFPN